MIVTPSTGFSLSFHMPKLESAIQIILRRQNKFMTARATLFSVLLLGASWVTAQNTTPGSTSPNGSTSNQGAASTQSSSPGQTDTNQGAYGQGATTPANQGAQPTTTSPTGQTDTTGGNPSDQSGPKAGANASTNSIRGCLNGSAASGN